MSDVIALGPPPLTQEAADRAIDLVDFMAAVVRGVDTIDVTPAMREQWRMYLAGHYAALSPAERTWYATADATFANLQSSWSSLTDEQRNLNRANWAMTLPTVLQFAQPVLQGAGGGAPTMPMSAPAPTPASAPSSISSLITTIHQGQVAHANEVYELAGGGEAGLAAKARIEAENQALNMKMLTEMSNLRYEAMKNVWSK
jgi:hypothetical protein